MSINFTITIEVIPSIPIWNIADFFCTYLEDVLYLGSS